MADSTFEPEVKRSLEALADNMPMKSIKPLAIECKKCQSAYLTFDRVKEHQVEGLLNFKKKPYAHKMRVASPIQFSERRFTGTTDFDFILSPRGESFLLVNFRFTKKAPRQDIAKGTNRCFAVTPEQWLEAVELYKADGGASVNYDWFCENAKEIPRDKFKVVSESGKERTEYGWDLRHLYLKG